MRRLANELEADLKRLNVQFCLEDGGKYLMAYWKVGSIHYGLAMHNPPDCTPAGYCAPLMPDEAHPGGDCEELPYDEVPEEALVKVLGVVANDVLAHSECPFCCESSQANFEVEFTDRNKAAVRCERCSGWGPEVTVDDGWPENAINLKAAAAYFDADMSRKGCPWCGNEEMEVLAGVEETGEWEAVAYCLRCGATAPWVTGRSEFEVRNLALEAFHGAMCDY